jgi:formylglycine-generating enzyme required for sulfatase activity
VKNLKKSIVCAGLISALLLSGSYAAEVKNLAVTQQGNRVVVRYDLVGKLGEKEADVSAAAEIDGERYSADKLTLSGDVGKKIKIGKGKSFAWDGLKDFPTGFEGDVTWDVEASGAPVAAPAPAPVVTSGSGFSDPTTGMQFVPVPAGCFLIKSGIFSSQEVCLDSFRIGKFEVTQEQYQKVTGSNPSNFKNCGVDCPVENVSWYEAQEFISKLNRQTGKSYRLPTEAEWHYACTSGGKNEKYCGSDNEDAVAWYDGNSGKKTHPVGQKQPNGLGIYDMSGNVSEWMQDLYSDTYPSSQRNPTGAASSYYRVNRGGVGALRKASDRFFNTPWDRYSALGFRLVAPVQ